LCNMLIDSRGSWAWQVQKPLPPGFYLQKLLPTSRVQHSCSSRRLTAFFKHSTSGLSTLTPARYVCIHTYVRILISINFEARSGLLLRSFGGVLCSACLSRAHLSIEHHVRLSAHQQFTQTHTSPRCIRVGKFHFLFIILRRLVCLSVWRTAETQTSVPFAFRSAHLAAQWIDPK